MNKKKMLINLKNNNKTTFYLYNTMYTITIENNNYKIYSYNGNSEYTYKSLKELLNNYMVYGVNLNNLLEDIKI